MKAFVYTKEQKPQKVAIINQVSSVYVSERTIHILTWSGADFTFNTEKYKTTIYQN